MVRDNRIKEYVFPPGSLLADAAGLFDVYSDHVINGTIHQIIIGSYSYGTTGSLILFESGIETSFNGRQLIRNTNASNNHFYPLRFGEINTNSVITSGTNFFTMVPQVVNSQLRLVGSGLVANSSGTYYAVRYI